MVLPSAAYAPHMTRQLYFPRLYITVLRFLRLPRVSMVQEQEDDYGGFMVQVMPGGSVEFAGELVATGLENMRSVFWNGVGGRIE